MIVYISIFLLLLVFGFYRNSLIKSKIRGLNVEILFFIFLSLIICGGYMTGSDWRNYEIDYYTSDFLNRNYSYSEPLFIYLISTMKLIIPDFFVFLIITKLTVFYIFYLFFKKHSTNIYISYFIYIPWFSLYIFIDNPLRFMIALSFVVLSFNYLLKSKFIKFFLLIFIGSLFHYSVLFFFPFYFIRDIKIKNWVLLISFTLWTLIFNVSNLHYILLKMAAIFPSLFSEYLGYLNLLEFVEDKIISPKVIFQFFVFICILMNRMKIEKHFVYGRIFFNFSIVYLFLSKIALYLGAGIRISHLFSFFYVIVFSFILISFYKTSVFKRIISFTFIAYTLIYSFIKIDSHYVYMPYSNYFLNILDNKSYYERSNYNLDEYFKRKGERYRGK